jgi:hypothetical protein
MKVGEGNLGSLCSSCSFAFLAASFLRHRSTDAAAASSVNRSMIVVAVKSTISLVHHMKGGQTSYSLLISTEVFQSGCSPLESLDATWSVISQRKFGEAY